jgi:hypothetical protein
VIRQIGGWSSILTSKSDVLLGSKMSEKTFDGHPGTQESAVGVRRALLTHLLVDGSEQIRVVVDRRDLGRLFERRRDDIGWEIFSPRLKVCDFLEDAIEYLEAEMTEVDTRPAEESRESPCTCWFTTPGVDFDVVLQTLQRAQNHHFVGMVFGPWPHGSAVYALDSAIRPRGFGLSCEPLCGIPAMTEDEAFRALVSCRI